MSKIEGTLQIEAAVAAGEEGEEGTNVRPWGIDQQVLLLGWETAKLRQRRSCLNLAENWLLVGTVGEAAGGVS